MIDQHLLQKVLQIEIEDQIIFSNLGLSNSSMPDTLSFIDDLKYLSDINENKNITGVICTSEFKSLLTKKTVLVTDARFSFYTLHNYLAVTLKKTIPSEIDKSATISPNCYIHSENVIIGKNTIIQPNVTILGDVEIGDNCFIQSGTVIGSEGYEYKKTSQGILPVVHDGKVIIGNFVHVGANTCIDKGFSFRNTIIDNQVKIDNLIHVAHGVNIQEGAFIIAGTTIGGSCTIESDSWLSINSSIAPGITVKKKGFVSIGAVVTKDVNENEQVTGNFAIPHGQFIAKLKRSQDQKE